MIFPPSSWARDSGAVARRCSVHCERSTLSAVIPPKTVNITNIAPIPGTDCPRPSCRSNPPPTSCSPVYSKFTWTGSLSQI